MSVEFCGPPPPTKGPAGAIFTDEVQEALKARPGDWAIIHRAKHPGAAGVWRIRHGDKGFEFTSRRTGDGDQKFSIYARFVGTGQVQS